MRPLVALVVLASLAPPTEHAKLAGRVAENLKLLKHVDASKQPSVTPALRAGAELVGGHELGGAPSAESPMLAFMEWRKNHPFPQPGDPPEARKAYYQALRKATDEWLKQWPGHPSVLGYRLEALGGDEDVPASELVAVAEAAIKVEESAPGRTFPPLITRVAEIYARRDIQLDKVPEMARKGLERAERGPGGQSGLSPARQMPIEMRRSRQAALHSARWMGWSATVEAYLKLNQPARARETLFEMEKWLRENKPAEDDQRAQANYPYRQGSYWSGMARLAEQEGRKLDALACYQMALSLVRSSPATTAKARALWKELGGTNEGWQAFLASLEPKEAKPAVTATTSTGGPQWTKIDKPLPKFELQDPGGKTWRLAQFEGKTLLVNLWATWCAPCLAELPYIQKLHEKVRDRSDVAVLTLNIDDNTGLVQPFLDRKKYTFPALLAKSYVEGVLPEMGIPRNWIVDGQGVWKLELLGFDLRRVDKLADEVLEAMEKAK